MKELEKQQKELFEEALRVSDVSFLLFDYYRSSSNAYSAILRQQELSMQSNESNEETFDTIIQNSSDSISSEPLPPCWIQEDEANSEVLQ
ncbi:hypothetical protein GPJ56_001793 [Histomonas meleagridis]|uniref:uncharacterized protein n=1 Tax=Histomonas meleagridis TaxID=135588 RepID=UPI00355944EE|nr:hypothetical protein GPJ56_001793 [Histomonas meleagridis]KAH0803270.1 hypothetical protein GO595_004006 [Histomonas meleagridis]